MEPGTRLAVRAWAKRLGKRTVSTNIASGGESSKTFGSSAFNIVSLTENDIPGARLLEKYRRDAMENN